MLRGNVDVVLLMRRDISSCVCEMQKEKKNISHEDTTYGGYKDDDDKWEEKNQDAGSNKWLTKLIECHFEDRFRSALAFISL